MTFSNHSADLCEDNAARGARCHGLDEVVDVEALALHCDVAHRVGGRAADDGDIDWDCLIQKVLLAVYLPTGMLCSTRSNQLGLSTIKYSAFDIYLTSISCTRSSLVNLFIFPPLIFGSAIVPKPTSVTWPGNLLAADRIILDRDPSGSPYASILLAATKAPIFGAWP